LAWLYLLILHFASARLAEILGAFNIEQQKILVIGDLMLDEFLWGKGHVFRPRRPCVARRASAAPPYGGPQSGAEPGQPWATAGEFAVIGRTNRESI